MTEKFIRCSLLPLLAGVLLLGSCVNDDTLEGTGQYRVEPDIPVTLSLKVMLSGNKIATRAAQSDEAERTINNIYVIAFKPEKNQDGTENGNAADDQWVVDNAKNFEVGKAIDYNSAQTLEDGFPMTTGIRKIYAIGNPQSGSGSLSEEYLAKIKTLADLKSLGSALRDKQSIERMDFKMTGQVLQTSGIGNKELVTVRAASGGSGEIVENYELELKRVDARITFKIRGTGGYEFTPEYYRVMNIPGGTYVLPREKGSATENTWDFQTGGYAEGFRTSDFSTDNEGASLFEFYLCENRQNPKQKITRDMPAYEQDHTLYSYREKQEKTDLPEVQENGQKVENGDFVYAPQNSTYVILGGTVTGERMNNDGQIQEVYAKVTYTIHLGATGNGSSNGTNWLNDDTLANNYDIERNTHYTYNVTVAGVEKIIVEVQSDNGDNEEQPGAEGDVILTEGTVVTLDSHYSRYLMTLKKSEILKGLSWSISTPFQRGLKVCDNENTFEAEAYLAPDNIPETAHFGLSENTLALNDYKWVKFAVNKECIRQNGSAYNDEHSVIKFPGEQAYDGGNGKDTPAPIAGGTYYRDGNFYSQARLYDVNQLLNFLYYKATQEGTEEPDNSIFTGHGDDRHVDITIFIDEYNYIYDPTQYFYRQPTGVTVGDDGDDGIVDLSLWKRVVNAENRLLNICVEGSKYSADGESSVSQSVYTISQRPIYTFYNPGSEDLETAWGVEATLETKFLPIVPSGVNDNAFIGRFDGKANTSDNGRSNTLNILRNGQTLRWDQVLNTDISDIDNILLDDYKSVWYACLTRNRDLNGDDIVQESEIRWYLASVDQLTDMWIGEAGIPTAKLYQAQVGENWVPGTLNEGTDRVHVASSSYYESSPIDPWVIWAEESASRGDAGYSKTVVGNLYSYRCVRNLGLKLTDRERVPDDYLTTGTSVHTTPNGETYPELTIDISRLTDNCIRPSTGENAVLSAHTERDPYGNNRAPLTLAIIGEENETPTQYLYPRVTDGEGYREINGLDFLTDEFPRPCPQGYRMPNQRELMLIYTTYPELVQYTHRDEFFFLCRTGFSYQTNEIGKEGNGRKALFAYRPSTRVMQLRADHYATNGVVRCVRDATDNPGGN